MSDCDGTRFVLKLTGDGRLNPCWGLRALGLVLERGLTDDINVELAVPLVVPALLGLVATPLNEAVDESELVRDMVDAALTLPGLLFRRVDLGDIFICVTGTGITICGCCCNAYIGLVSAAVGAPCILKLGSIMDAMEFWRLVLLRSFIKDMYFGLVCWSSKLGKSLMELREMRLLGYTYMGPENKSGEVS